LREQARRLREETDYAVMYNARYNLVHQTQYSRGFEDWYYDLGQNHDLFCCLMDAVLEVMLEWNRLAFEQMGDLIDIVAFGDDIGLQDRPVCSPALYRKLIRPYQERIVDSIRRQTRAKILYHTCGSVYYLIPDFIEMGIDALNPVQVTARNMEPERLKAEFGGRIAFWGGIDSQHLLPHGSPQDVRAGVRRMFDIMGPGGGYVLAAVHNVQPDAPADNILAMFDEGRRCVYAPVPAAA
jgi:uroporphyrinogen decarboxylase